MGRLIQTGLLSSFSAPPAFGLAHSRDLAEGARSSLTAGLPVYEEYSGDGNGQSQKASVQIRAVGRHRCCKITEPIPAPC